MPLSVTHAPHWLASLVVAALALTPMPARAATTEVCVAIVVDFGSGGPSAPTRTCVTVPQGATGADVLAARARKLGRPAPRWDGYFLCAIDGYPADECGTDPGVDRYWSYWHRIDGRWQYSNLGAFDYTVTDADHDGDPDVEGWHFVTGDNAAPASGSYDAICPPSASPSPRRTSAAPAPAATTAAPAPPASRPRQPSTSPAAATRPGPTPSRTPTPRRPSHPPSPTPEPTATTADLASDAGGGGLPLGTLAGAALVTLLAGAAAVRFRRGSP